MKRVSAAAMFLTGLVFSADYMAQPASRLEPGTDNPPMSSGELIAQEWCGVCHAIPPRTLGRAGSAPDLRAIADDPDTSTASLIRIMKSPHAAMTTKGLRQAEMEAVAAYILSLRSPK